MAVYIMKKKKAPSPKETEESEEIAEETKEE